MSKLVHNFFFFNSVVFTHISGVRLAEIRVLPDLMLKHCIQVVIAYLNTGWGEVPFYASVLCPMHTPCFTSPNIGQPQLIEEDQLNIEYSGPSISVDYPFLYFSYAI
jgi:hypothetical protein